ncbi:hypothetical protein WQO_33620 [Streptomyces globisporus C-1027]|uniref:Uncharacterized protein n=1 Tax=Streptomyces globisporus C-1027 TaxID=1172567 RepID=A0A0U3KG80_STRGL|nr:hypothetical protein WQO_33620 [Streptomyces globisporus C-1027]
MQQRRFGGGAGAVALLVLAVAPAAVPDDSPVLVALDVDRALPARECPGSELLDQTFVMRCRFVGV